MSSIIKSSVSVRLLLKSRRYCATNTSVQQKIKEQQLQPPPPASTESIIHEEIHPLTVPETRPFPETSVVKTESPTSIVLRQAASFDEVPGPEILKQIAKVWSYVPIIGNQVTARSLQYVLSAGKVFGSQLSWGNNMAFFRYLLNEYGPIVRLRGPFGGDVVILSRPEHASAVFESDGPYPVRSSLDCIEKYRLQHRKYKNAGPFVMHGPEWETMRKNIEPALKASVEHQCARISKTADDFIDRLLAIRNQQLEVPKTFLTELQKWSIECLCSVAFSRSLGLLDARGISSSSENAMLLKAIIDATSAIKSCEFGLHLWKLFETPTWKKLVVNCDTINHILGSNLRKTQQQLRDAADNQPAEVSLVDYLLLKESMSTDDILTVLLDMALLGVNMSAYSAGFLMYHLAKNQRAQSKLLTEIQDLPEEIGKEDIQKLSYLRACFYESLRLKPPMPILNRVLNKDIVIYGYKIPKGTVILIATNLSSLREEHFEDPLKFQPERWIDIENGKALANLATIPFGRGPKDCLAKEFAEIQIYYLMIKILRKFRIEYNYGDIDSNNKLLSLPSRPFKFRFIERF